MKFGKSSKENNFSFLNLFSIPKGEHSLEVRVKLREIGVFYWACLIFIPYFIAEQSFAYKTTRYFPVLIPLYALLALSPIIYKKTKNFHLYASYVAAFGLTLVILLIAYEGGNRSPGAFWLMGTPLICGLVYGPRGVWVGTFLMVATLLAFLGLNHLQILPNLVLQHGDYEKEKLINLVGFGLYNVITSYYFIYTEEKTQKKLREQKQETDNLLRMLMHDVANPINAIRLVTHTSKTGHDNHENVLELIDETITELSAIVQQIRKLRALQDGKLNLTMTQVSIQAALIETVNLLRPQAKHKGVELKLKGDDERAYVLADEPLLKSTILANLINNSIKFSYPGQTITIGLTVEPTRLLITVQDEGLGIPEGIIEQIFDPTAPTSHKGTRGERGTGYGLPLAKAYVEKLGGDINLTSSQENGASGTAVTIGLPRYFAEQNNRLLN